jgi:hypothetical protein
VEVVVNRILSVGTPVLLLLAGARAGTEAEAIRLGWPGLAGPDGTFEAAAIEAPLTADLFKARKIWESECASLAVVGGVLIVPDQAGGLLGVDCATGAKRWALAQLSLLDQRGVFFRGGRARVS